jgi:hypothetical protein
MRRENNEEGRTHPVFVVTKSLQASWREGFLMGTWDVQVSARWRGL